MACHAQAKWRKTKGKGVRSMNLLAVHFLLPGSDDDAAIEQFIAERISSNVTSIENLIEEARKTAF